MESDPVGEADDALSDGTGLDAVVQRQQAALAARDDVVVVLDRQGTVQAVRGDIEALLGDSTETLEGEPIESLLAEQTAVHERGEQESAVTAPGADSEDTAETGGEEGSALRRTLLSGESTTVAATLSGGDTPVPVTVSTAPVPDRAETVCVLEPRQRPDSADPPMDLVETLGDPLFVLDSERTLERVNDAMVEYTGYEREELLGRGVGEIIPPGDYGPFVDQLREAAAEGRQTTTVELRLVTSGGAVVLSEAHASVLTGREGEYARAVCVLRDVSERKQREQDIELLNQILSRVFRHNVRNKLNVAKGHAELLREEPDGDATAHAEAILDTTERLVDLSEKARLIEAVVDTEERRSVDLVRTAEHSLEAVSETHPEADIEVDLPDSAAVTAHPRIGAAITELIDNAIRHAPPAEDPRVQLRVEVGDEIVSLYVEDESGGLSDPEIDVLREGAESALEHLSGLGLWLVRWLADHSGATLIAQRTERGSLMGIRFGRSRGQRGGFGTPPVSRSSRPTGRDSARLHGQTVVGRVAALNRLEDTYAALERKGGHAVFVTGASGIGKTTLVETFLDRLTDEEPPLVSVGRCTEGVTPPYDVFRQLLDRLPASTDPPDVFDDVAVRSGDDSEAVQQRRQSLFTAVAGELRDLAAESPLVLVLEDIHLADSATTALLEYLIDEVGRWTYPILFLCTANTGELDGSHPVRRFTADTASNRVEQLDLDPLDRGEVRRLLRHVLDIDRVPPAVLDDICDHTGGNPLFVSEVCRDLAARLGPEPSPDDLLTHCAEFSLSATAERAVADRIDGLSPADRRLLQLGAVVGGTVDIDVLVRASDRPEPAVRDALERLVTSRLWERTDEGVAFVHGLVREGALASMDSERRRDCHRRVAAAIETVHADDLERQYGRLGEHYEQADQPAQATAYYRQAGERAREAYGHEVAIENHERALELGREHGVLEDRALAAVLADIAEAAWAVGDLAVADDRAGEGLGLAPEESRVRCRLLDIRANVRNDRGEFDSARETTTTQRSLAETVGARDLEASALRRLGSLARRRSEYEQARDYYETALDIARTLGNRLVEARILKGIGGIAYERGDFEQAHAHATESLDITQELGDRRQEARTFNVLGAIASNRGAYDRARECYRRSLDIDGQLGDRHAQARTLNNLGLVARRQGAYDEAREHYQQSLDIARELDDRKGEAYSLHNIGEVEVYRGACEPGRAHLQESLEMVRTLGDTRVEVANLVRLGDCERIDGNLDRAADHYSEALDTAEECGLSRWEANSRRGLGVVARRRNRYGRASDHLDAALAGHEDIDNRSGAGEVRVELGRLALARGNLERAERQARLAQDTLGDLDAAHWLGRCHRLLGAVADERGESDAACEHWQRALDTFEQVDTPRDELHTLASLVEIRHEQGDDERAREWCRQARTTLEDAPDSVAGRHREWVETAASELGLD